MKRMTEEKALLMLDFIADKFDVNNLPLDDSSTFELFQRADTDGIFMMESEWDKYDLRQIKQKNMDELTATIALSHGLAVNPYIYTYLKIQKIQPFTYPRFTEMERVKEILSDTHGMLLWKEQKEEILAYIDSLSDEEKERYSSAIKIVLHEIELRQHSLSNRKFFRNRAMICYKLAYIKAHMTEDFERLRMKLCN
jgi:DNA polymerase-3 subunit alpha